MPDDILDPIVPDGSEVIDSPVCKPHVIKWDVSSNPNITASGTKVIIDLSSTPLCGNVKYRLKVPTGAILDTKALPVEIPVINFKTGV